MRQLDARTDAGGGGDRTFNWHSLPGWTVAQECDPAWWALAREWGGGFFHHASALSLGTPNGTPLVMTCTDDDGVAALAVGTRWHCRLSSRARHAYFPSLPLLRPGADAVAIIQAFGVALTAAGINEVTCDSFDATPESRRIAWGTAGADRCEYRVTLDATPAVIASRLSSHHNRLIQRGDRDGFRMDIGLADDAIAALALVSHSATERGATRGNPFDAAPWQLTAASAESNEHWGVTICRALRGDTLLSAALIGWGGTRAFYLGGGSTSDGYASGSATWMHWRTMLALRERGVTSYNLGGTPAGASAAGHPSHGLHRFKAAFGAAVVPLRGLSWADSSVHTSMHRVASRLPRARAVRIANSAPAGVS